MRMLIYILCIFIFNIGNCAFAELKEVPYIYNNNILYWPNYYESFLREAPMEVHSKFMRKFLVHADSLSLDYRTINVSKVLHSNSNLEFFPKGIYELKVDNMNYNLSTFYFISNSSFRVLGQQYPLELHLLYKSKLSNEYTKKPDHLVLVILFEIGTPNSFIDSLINNLPTNDSEPYNLILDNVSTSIKLDVDGELIPSDISNFLYYEDYVNYKSFTSKGLSFVIFNNKLTLSQEQSDIINDLIGNPKLSVNKVKNILNNTNKFSNIEDSYDVSSDDELLLYKNRLAIDHQYYYEQNLLNEASLSEGFQQDQDNACNFSELAQVEKTPDVTNSTNDDSSNVISSQDQATVSNDNTIIDDSDVKTDSSTNAFEQNNNVEEANRPEETFLQDLEDTSDLSDLY